MIDTLLILLALVSWILLPPLLTRTVDLTRIHKTNPQPQKLIVTALVVAVVVSAAVWSTLAVLT